MLRMINPHDQGEALVFCTSVKPHVERRPSCRLARRLPAIALSWTAFNSFCIPPVVQRTLCEKTNHSQSVTTGGHRTHNFIERVGLDLHHRAGYQGCRHPTRSGSSVWS